MNGGHNMKRLLSVILVTALFVTVGTGIYFTKTKAFNFGINSPRVSNGVTTWDCVYFGSYAQSSDNNGGFKTEPIKWRVLSVTGDSACILADRAIDCKPYNNNYEYTSWETCSLRSWLNNSFYNTAFNSLEKSAILTAEVINEANPYYGTDGGNNTFDKIYLLSIMQVRASDLGFDEPNYLIYTKTRECYPTDYAKNNGVEILKSYDGFPVSPNCCAWWLRSPGSDPDHPCSMHNSDGDYCCNVDSIGVRPVLNLDLNSSTWSKAGTTSAGEKNTTESSTPKGSTVQTTTKNDRTNQGQYIHNKKPKVKKVSAKKKSLKITWAKVNGASGYQIQYSRKKSMKGAKNITIKKANTTSITIKKLKKKKKYYVRIRTFILNNGVSVYSPWSAKKAKKTK